MYVLIYKLKLMYYIYIINIDIKFCDDVILLLLLTFSYVKLIDGFNEKLVIEIKWKMVILALDFDHLQFIYLMLINCYFNLLFVTAPLII